MGMIILIGFLLLGICMGIKAIFCPSSLELNKQDKKYLGASLCATFILAVFVPTLFTVWAALLINAKMVILLTAAYFAWNIWDKLRLSKKILKTIDNGEEQALHSPPAYIRVPLGVIEITYLSYLVYCLYLLM
jgi:hypothetical protein